MQDIYNINFELQVEQLIPPTKRKRVLLDYAFSLSRPLQRLRDLLFDSYKKGSIAAFYNNGTTYYKYDHAIWTNDGVYECLQNGTIGIPPISTGSELYWRKVQDNYVGTDERLKYNSQFIILAYSINKRFRVTSAPYIYFLVDNSTPGATLVIKVPSAVFTALGASTAERKKVVFDFADKYMAAGVLYDVGSY